jgi:hypothetical protein
VPASKVTSTAEPGHYTGAIAGATWDRMDRQIRSFVLEPGRVILTQIALIDGMIVAAFAATWPGGEGPAIPESRTLRGSDLDMYCEDAQLLITSRAPTHCARQEP